MISLISNDKADGWGLVSLFLEWDGKAGRRRRAREDEARSLLGKLRQDADREEQRGREMHRRVEEAKTKLVEVMTQLEAARTLAEGEPPNLSMTELVNLRAENARLSKMLEKARYEQQRNQYMSRAQQGPLGRTMYYEHQLALQNAQAQAMQRNIQSVGGLTGNLFGGL